MNEKEFIKEVKRVFASLAVICPFTYPLLTLPIKINSNLKSYAATSSTWIAINPLLWVKLNNKQKLFVALHEWLHISLMHPKRMRTRKADIFNYACDFVVNWMILADFKEIVEPPPGLSLYDQQYASKAVEEVYKDLVKGMEDQKNGEKPNQTCGNKNFLNRQDAINQLLNEQSSEDQPNVGNDVFEMPEGTNEQDLIDQIIKAAARHKMMSRIPLPNAFEEEINKLRKSKVPWTRILARLAKQALKKPSDRNPFKPDPKYLPYDIFVPTETSSGVPKVVLIVDTSGSMSSEEFEYALGHIEKVCKVCEKLTVIMADTEVRETIKIRNLKHEMKNNMIKFTGRGGTDMNLAFKKAEDLRPDLIILYSDMWIPEFPPRPKAPVIFLSRNECEEKPPYGTYLHVKDPDNE